MAKKVIVAAFLFIFWFSAICQQQPDLSRSCFRFTNLKSFDSTPIIFDKAFLENALGNKRFVLLGEQTHREGSVTSMKVKLIKYLHEEMGYNILAFEDDFFSLYQLNRQILHGSFPSDFQGRFSPVISENQEFKEMLDYLKECYSKGNPLFILGFDSQIFGEDNDNLIMDLSGYLQSKSLILTEAELEFLRIELAEVSNFPHEGNPLANQTIDLKFDLLLKKIKKTIDPQADDTNSLFWNQVIFLMEQTFENVRKEKSGKGEPVQNFRDRMMAENYMFLANQFKDEKIIGWGASYHFASNLNRHEPSPTTDQYAERLAGLQHESPDEPIYNLLEEAVTMGDILKKAYGDQVYSLAFTTGGGSYGVPGQDPIPVLPPPEGSIEHRLKKNNKNATWIDFSNDPSCNSFLAAPLGYLPIKAPWRDVFDGLLYLPVVKPLTKMFPHHGATNPFPPLKLKGKVIDANNNERIPFAHIVVLGRSNEGSATNESGKFEISMKLEERDTLKISSLGYESALVVVGKDGIDKVGEHINIKLKATSFLLQEVVVSANGPTTPEAVMRKVIANIKTNYPQTDVFLELFLRSKLYEEDQLLDKKEVVLDFYSPDGYTVKGYDLRSYNNNHFAKVKQVRNFYPERPMGMPYLDLMNLDIVGGTKDLLRLKKLRNYDFELEAISSYDGMPVYVLSFTDRITRPVKAYNYTSHYSGRLYINAENYAIQKYESTWERVLPKFSGNGDAPVGTMETTNHRFDIQTTYQEFNGSYHLKTGKISYSTVNKNQTRKSVVEFLTTAIENEFEVGDMLRLTELPIHEPPYDPLFWSNYNIVIDDQ